MRDKKECVCLGLGPAGGCDGGAGEVAEEGLVGVGELGEGVGDVGHGLARRGARPFSASPLCLFCLTLSLFLSVSLSYTRARAYAPRTSAH